MAQFHARDQSVQVNVAGDNTGSINVTNTAAVPARPVVRTSLRRDVGTLVGRDIELQRVLEAAGPGRGVSIVAVDGMAGVGKTALVTRAAHLLAERFPDGRYFVEMHAHTPGRSPADPSEVLAGLLIDMGMDPGSIPVTLGERRNLFRDRLSGKRVLLVLDDARGQAQIEPLLPGGTGCLTLVTSRRRLVAFDDAKAVALDLLAPDAAAELFCALMDRDPAEDQWPAIGQIVALCGYLPLAIVLLAGRMAHHPTWTIRELAAEFAATRDHLGELDTGERAVRTAFTMSYDSLPSTRQRLFRLLGLHPGLDTDAAAAAALAGVPVEVARRELEALYIVHLIDEIRPGRYRLHDLLREYAGTLAAADPGEETERARDRVLEYYQHAAGTAGKNLVRLTRPSAESANPIAGFPGTVPEFDSEPQALEWMRTERANLLACLEQTAQRRPDRVVELTGALAGLLERDGPWPLARRLHHRAVLAARRHADSIGEANALSDLGRVCELTGDYTAAADLAQQALAIYRGAGNRLGEANCLTHIGMVRAWTGDYAEAARSYVQARNIYRDIGNRLGEASTLGNHGNVCQWQSSYTEAVDLQQQALSLFRDLGNRLGEAGTLSNLGIVREQTGDYADASDLFRESLEIERRIGDRLGEANAVLNLGRVQMLRGRYPEAIASHEQALVIYREMGNQLGAANALANLGMVHQQTENYSVATDLHQQGLSMSRELGNPVGEVTALANLGIIHEETGDYTEAADLFEQTLALFRELGNRAGEAETLNMIGKLALQRGEPAKALGILTTAFELAGRVGSPALQAKSLHTMARCRAALGETTTAVAELRQAITIYRRLAAPEAEAAATYLATLERDMP